MGLKNDLLLRVLRGEKTSRRPVWMMRQAGRYLPEFQAIRKEYDFFTCCYTPDLAAELTVQPVHRLGVDAAILFSDILVVPQAMGAPFEMKPGLGPFLPHKIDSLKAINQLNTDAVSERLDYVGQAILRTQEKLAGKVPLIGFAGAPWTIFCYLVEGQGSHHFLTAKRFYLNQPQAAHALMDKIITATLSYLKMQIEKGVDILQLFDSWAGILPPDEYQTFVLPYLKRLIEPLASKIPFILFARGITSSLLPQLSRLGVQALGLDWSIDPGWAQQALPGVTLQGNLDPSYLLSSPDVIVKKTRKMLSLFTDCPYIANLGHGILPQTPVEHAQIFIDTVQSFS